MEPQKYSPPLLLKQQIVYSGKLKIFSRKLGEEIASLTYVFDVKDKSSTSFFLNKSLQIYFNITSIHPNI